MQLSTWFGRTHTEPFFSKELKYPSGYIDKLLKISNLGAFVFTSIGIWYFSWNFLS